MVEWGRGEADDEGVDAVRELNAVKECQEVEREIGARALLLRLYHNLERVGGGRQQMDLHANMIT